MRAGLHRHVELKRLQDFFRPLLPTLLGKFRSAHGRRPDPGAIETHIQLMRFRGQSHDAAARSTLVQPQLEQVLAIDRKVVANRQTPARSPRQIFAEATALIAIGRHEERLGR